MRTLDRRGASRGGEVIGRRNEGGEVRAVSRCEGVTRRGKLKGVQPTHAREAAQPAAYRSPSAVRGPVDAHVRLLAPAH
jgi:hypothetical protein